VRPAKGREQESSGWAGVGPTVAGALRKETTRQKGGGGAPAGVAAEPRIYTCAMMAVEQLTKRFGSLTAVAGLSFDLRPGETFGLLGPNGAGKTTTILMLMGALRPDAGRITLDGQAMSPALRRRLGVAPQSLALYENMTGEGNLRFFGSLYGLRGTSLAGRVGWALDLAGLAARRRDRVATYSGGMKRRLNLACALVHDPAVVLVDEPTVGVDPQSRNHIFEALEHLRDAGRTILYTTHYMEEAERLCDRVAIMDHGRVLALDTVDGLIAAHGGDSVIRAELAEPAPAGVELPGRLDGRSIRIETAAPSEVLRTLAGSGVRLGSLVLERPDLERVFLSLTGRTLRD
jgi:ABC-2 type transport system ATP-binding protein